MGKDCLPDGTLQIDMNNVLHTKGQAMVELEWATLESLYVHEAQEPKKTSKNLDPLSLLP